MKFTTTHVGTDYIQVTMDVHRDQLFEVMKTITEALEPAPAAVESPRRADPRDVPRWLWDLLTADLRANPRPRCFICLRAVLFRDRRSPAGALFAVVPATRDAQVACRKCVAEGRVQTLVDALRPASPESVLSGELAGVRLPALGGEVQVIRLNESATHVVLAPLVGRGGDADREVGHGHVGRVDPDHLGVAVVPPVLEPEAGPAVGGAGAGEAQEDPNVELGAGVEAQRDGVRAERDLKADRGRAHGFSSRGGRCAVAQPADGSDEAEPTAATAAYQRFKARAAGDISRIQAAAERMATALAESREDDTELDCEGPEAGDVR